MTPDIAITLCSEEMGCRPLGVYVNDMHVEFQIAGQPTFRACFTHAEFRSLINTLAGLDEFIRFNLSNEERHDDAGG